MTPEEGVLRLTSAPAAYGYPRQTRQAAQCDNSRAILAAVALLLALRHGRGRPAQATPASTRPPTTTAGTPAASSAGSRAFRKEAAAKGISRATIAAVLDGMTMDPGIISRDRRQGFFAQSFTAFSGKLISQNRMQTAPPAQAASRPAGQGREGIRRAGARDRRVLGARERLRRRHGQPARAALARHAGLRLPPARDVPRRADGRAAHHRPRRPAGPRR